MSLADGQTPAPPLIPPLRKPRRFAGLRTIVALMLREMATTNTRSAGGYLWAILEPVAGILLLTAIFSAAFRTPPIGVNFPIFYATGLVPFTLYASVSGKMAASLQFSRALLAYPTVTFVDALLARFLVNIMTQIMVAYLIFSFILLIYDTRTILELPRIIEAFVMAAVLAAGIGVMNCYLFSAFPLWQQLWAIVNRPLFILSGLFFTFESIPQPYRDYLWYNPLIHVVGMSRSGFYPTYDADYVSRIYVYGIGFGLMLFGLLFLKRFHRDLIDN